MTSGASTAGAAAGLRALVVPDAVQGVSLPVWVLYPTHSAPTEHTFGPYAVQAAANATPAGGGLPIVLLSHGNGGSPWTHRHTATHLAQAGFAVVLVDHLGNSRTDNALAGTLANLENRPRHLRLALDAALADPRLGPALDAGRVGALGHSIGAYTVLAAAGGLPGAGPHETLDGQPCLVAVASDERVRALALLAPAGFWFQHPGALDAVTAPLLVRVGAADTITPPTHAQALVSAARNAAHLDFEIVENAGHFSFQSPYPPALQRPDFPPAHDPPGFDRAAYQPHLNAQLAAFFAHTLAPG